MTDKPETFTVRLAFDPAEPLVYRHLTGLFSSDKSLMAQINAARVRKRVKAWLSEANRAQHLLMIYDNTDLETGKGELAVVLNDRDTAIMLKLAFA